MITDHMHIDGTTRNINSDGMLGCLPLCQEILGRRSLIIFVQMQIVKQ